MTYELVQVNKHIVAEQIVDFVLARVVTGAQPPDGAAFVRCVMIDVQPWVVFPAGERPVDERLECYLFPSPIVSPQSRNSN
jgi:hypothetical protein